MCYPSGRKPEDNIALGNYAKGLAVLKIIAHRGAPRVFPENTLPSFAAALDAGARWVELDVRFTRDYVPVVFHDPRLTRLTLGGELGDCRYASLPTVQGFAIPTLEEVVQLLAARGAGAYVELKEDSPLMLEKVLPIVSSLEKKVVSSFHFPLLERARQAEENLPLMALYRSVSSDLGLARELKASVGMALRGASAACIEKVRREELEAWVYTVNTPSQARRLYQLGVTGIFSDVADLLLAQPFCEA
jgi:glycerophosphoryl diester phosphodiesterase